MIKKTKQELEEEKKMKKEAEEKDNRDWYHDWMQSFQRKKGVKINMKSTKMKARPGSREDDSRIESKKVLTEIARDLFVSFLSGVASGFVLGYSTDNSFNIEPAYIMMVAGGTTILGASSLRSAYHKSKYLCTCLINQARLEDEKKDYANDWSPC